MNDPRRFLIVLALLVAIGLALPFLINRGLLFLAALVAINIVLGLSFNLLFSTIGLLSFGQSAFSAVGAYTAALLLLHVPALPYTAILLATALSGAVLALLIGIVALRRTEGVYFAILTLAFSALLNVVIAKTTVLGRNDGLTGIPLPAFAVGGNSFYHVIICVTALLAAILWWVTNSRLGRSFRAVRLDPMRAAFLGIDTHKKRLQAFMIAGATTAAAGGLLAPLTGIVSPDLAHWSESTKPILFTLLGGAGTFWGPALGAVVYAAVEYGTRSLAGAADLITGFLLLIVVLAVPGGLLSLVLRLLRRRPPATNPAIAVQSEA